MARTARFAVLLVVVAAWALAGVAPAAAGGGCHVQEFTDERAREIKAVGNCFVPTVARVAVGDTVTWFGGGGIEHTVTGVSRAFGDGASASQVLVDDAPVSVTFADSGVYPYVCALHPMMAGAVVVGDGRPAGRDAAMTSAGDTGAAARAEAPADASVAGGSVAGGSSAGSAGAGDAVAASAGTPAAGTPAGATASAVGLASAGALVLLLVAVPRLVRAARARRPAAGRSVT